MFGVKTQDDFNKLGWEDKYRYVAQNPNSDVAKSELERTKKVLYTNPTQEAKNWYSGLQYAGKTGDAENAILGNYNPVGYEWKPGGVVRGNLNALGVTDDRIGWNNGKVTLDGKYFMTPDVVMGGRSYASDEDFRKALTDYNNKNNIVAVREYANAKSPQVNVGWDSELGQVMLGSKGLTPDYVENGVAYIAKSRVDDALASEALDTGVFSRQDILERNNARWDDRLARLYDRVENPERFSYHAESDPIYQDFKREWMKQNQAQYDDTIAKMNSQSGGTPSLGALAAAWNMLQNSNEQLDAYKQQFRQQAYNEWQNDYEQDVRRLEAALGMRENEFNREYGVNSDVINDMYTRKGWEHELKGSVLDREIAQEGLNQSRQLFPVQLETQKVNLDTLREQLNLQKQMTPYEVERAIQQVKMGELDLSQAELDYLVNRAKYYGINFDSGQGNGGDPDNIGIAPISLTKKVSYPPQQQEQEQTEQKQSEIGTIAVEDAVAEIYASGNVAKVRSYLNDAYKDGVIKFNEYGRLLDKYGK